MSPIAIFIAVMLAGVGLAGGVLAGWIGKPKWVRSQHIIAGAVLVITLSGVLVVVQGAMQSSGNRAEPESAPTASPSPSSLSTSETPSSTTLTTPTKSLRPLHAWVKDVETACRQMKPVLDKDLDATGAVDSDELGAGDQAALADFVSATRKLDKDYATLNGNIQGIQPPSHSAESANEWLKDFEQRGALLHNIAESLDSYLDGEDWFGITKAKFYNNQLKPLDESLRAESKQLGIKSCPSSL